MAQILVCGIVTLDVIQTVECYPEENSEQRASQQTYAVGGNAANSSYILKQLGHEPKLASPMADDLGAQFIERQLKTQALNYFQQWRIAHSCAPLSCITVTQNSASRTIVHYRDLPELTFEQFNSVDLQAFDWIHFEARNPDEQVLMLKKAVQTQAHISIEAEKERPNIDSLFEYANTLFFSQSFAFKRGFHQAQECLLHFANHYKDKLLICAWGEQGAWAWHQGHLYHSPSYPPIQLKDTLAAGDTFNAACIDGLLQGKSIHETLQSACKLAGKKCGQTGLHHLINSPRD